MELIMCGAVLWCFYLRQPLTLQVLNVRFFFFNDSLASNVQKIFEPRKNEKKRLRTPRTVRMRTQTLTFGLQVLGTGRVASLYPLLPSSWQHSDGW